MEERMIQYSQFLAARVGEIAQMQNIVESKFLNSTKIPYQILHKHLRRRAMSHNRYRIPSRLRKQMYIPSLVEQEKAQKLPKCRKHIRKNRLFVFMNRSRKVRWMETHIYQAKRMKMIEYSGVKVALNANEKNFRAMHRYIDHGCAIFDASYYQVVDGIVDNGLQVDNHTIIHPQDLVDTDFKVRMDEYSIFQVFGQESLNYINQFLDSVGYQIDGKKSTYISTNITNNKIMSAYTSNYKEVKTFDDFDDTFNMKQSTTVKGDEDIEHKIWHQADQSLRNIRYKIINRSRYTHKRKLKVEYQQKLKADSKLPKQQIKKVIPTEEVGEVNEDLCKKALRWVLNEYKQIVGEQPAIIQTEQPIEQEQQQPKQPIIQLPDSVINMLIIPPSANPIRQIDLGYKLIINLGQGIKVWKYFNSLKVKPMGLRDVRYLCLENNIQFHDYEVNDQFEKILRSKCRPNYLALQFPYPFESNWQLYQQWATCTLHAYKSIPLKLAIIFQPTQNDFKALEANKTKIEAEIKDIPAFVVSNRIDLLQYQKQLSEIKLDRKILGFITYGNSSLTTGKGIGQGKVTAELQSKKVVVLFRNPNSKYYFFADCIINSV